MAKWRTGRYTAFSGATELVNGVGKNTDERIPSTRMPGTWSTQTRQLEPADPAPVSLPVAWFAGDSEVGEAASRATDGQYYDVNGVLQDVTQNVKRDAHYTRIPRRNLLLNSSDLTAGSWASANVTITANADGTADRLVATGVENCRQDIAAAGNYTPGDVLTFSFKVKNNGGSVAQYSVYNWTAGADIVAPTSYFSQINGSTYTRVSVTFTVPAGCQLLAVYPLRDSGVGANVFVDELMVNPGATAQTYVASGATQGVAFDAAVGPTYLSEPFAVNLALSSKSVTTAGGIWVGTGVTTTGNDATAPDGTTTATRLQAGTAGHNLRQNITTGFSPGDVMTFSFWAKNNTGGLDAQYSVFDWTASAEIIPPTSYLSQLSTSEWRRVFVTFTVPAGCSNIGIYPLRTPSNSSPGVDMWVDEVLCEKNKYPTSNITTTTDPVMRGGDAYSVPIAPGVAATRYVKYIDLATGELVESVSAVTTATTLQFEQGRAWLRNAIDAGTRTLSDMQALYGTTITGTAAVVSVAAVAGSLSIGSLTPSGAAAVVNAVASAGALTLGGLTITGGASNVSVAASAGSLTLGSLTVQGGNATVTAVASAGSLTLGALTIQGSAAVVSVVAAQGTVTNAITLAGGVAAVSVVANAGSLTLGALTVQGGNANVSAVASAGSLTLGALTVAGGNANVSAVANAGSLTLGALTVQGSAAVVSTVAAAGSLTLGALTLAGGSANVTAVASAGSLTLGALTIQGSAAVVNAVAAQGSVSTAGTLSGGVAAVSVVAATGALTLGALSVTGGASVTSAVASAGSLTLGAIAVQGGVAATTVTAAPAAYTFGALTITGGTKPVSVVAASGSLSLTLILTAGVATVTAQARPGSLTVGSVTISGAPAIASAVAAPGAVMRGTPWSQSYGYRFLDLYS